VVCRSQPVFRGGLCVFLAFFFVTGGNILYRFGMSVMHRAIVLVAIGSLITVGLCANSGGSHRAPSTDESGIPNLKHRRSRALSFFSYDDDDTDDRLSQSYCTSAYGKCTAGSCSCLSGYTKSSHDASSGGTCYSCSSDDDDNCM
jgi:hypothetical protein